MSTLKDVANSVFRGAVAAIANVLHPEERQAAEQARQIQVLNAALFSDPQEIAGVVSCEPPFASLEAVRFSPYRYEKIDGFCLELRGTRANNRGTDGARYEIEYSQRFFVSRDTAVYMYDSLGPDRLGHDRSGWIPLKNSGKRILEQAVNAAEVIVINHAAQIAAIGAKIPAPVARAAHDARR